MYLHLLSHFDGDQWFNIKLVTDKVALLLLAQTRGHMTIVEHTTDGIIHNMVD